MGGDNQRRARGDDLALRVVQDVCRPLRLVRVLAEQLPDETLDAARQSGMSPRDGEPPVELKVRQLGRHLGQVVVATLVRPPPPRCEKEDGDSIICPLSSGSASTCLTC